MMWCAPPEGVVLWCEWCVVRVQVLWLVLLLLLLLLKLT